MSNGLPDPDSLLTPGWTPVDTVNCVLNGRNHTANGLNGPEFILFPMMAIANDRLRYQISIYALVHAHSFTPKPTVNESRSLRFPKILPFPPPPPLLHLPVSYRLPRVRKPGTVSDRESRRESSSRGRMHLEPCSYPLVSASPRFKVSLKPPNRRPQLAASQRGPTIVAGWSLYVDFLSSERWGGPR